ncbi:hypothetical protein DFQ27_009947, partial [Actinomortierella ambigua]
MTIQTDFPIQTDILGRQSIFDSYIPVTFAYPVEDISLRETILRTLKDGLHRLGQSFPWTAGQVVYKSAAADGENGMRIPMIMPLSDSSSSSEGELAPASPPLTVKDLSRDDAIPSFATLQAKHFPFSAAVMHESYLSPRRASPGVDPTEPTTQPTFMVQATWLKGGLLLTIVGHHAAMDAMGLGQVMALLCKACKNVPFTQEEIVSGNRRRDNSIPLLEDHHNDDAAEKPVSKEHFLPRATTTTTTRSPLPEKPNKCSWVYFDFDASSLTALKAEATKTLPVRMMSGQQQSSARKQESGSTTTTTTTTTAPFVSTDDALSALIWQSILRARRPRLDPAATTTLARAVDIRHLLGLSANYPGEAQVNSYATATVAS